MKTIKTSDPNSPEILRAYINTERRYGWIAYGLRVHWLGHVISAEGWVGGTQKVYAQMIALDTLLSAIETADIEPKVELILRTEYLRQRLDMARTHTLAAQIGQPKKPMQEDPERWMDVSTRAVGVGIRMAISEAEKQELSSIFLRLDDILAEKLRTYVGGPVEPKLSLEA